MFRFYKRCEENHVYINNFLILQSPVIRLQQTSYRIISKSKDSISYEAYLLASASGPGILTKFQYFDVWHNILEDLMKIWNLFYIKKIFEILSVFLHFWIVSSQKIFIVPLKRWKLFFLNPSFHTDFENINFILVKSAPKKVLAIKTILPIEKSPRWIGFLAKIIFECTFY